MIFCCFFGTDIKYLIRFQDVCARFRFIRQQPHGMGNILRFYRAVFPGFPVSRGCAAFNTIPPIVSNSRGFSLLPTIKLGR